MGTKIVFMGTPDFAVSSLDALYKAGYDIAAVVTVPDKPAGRGQKMSISAVKEYALEHNLPILQPEKLRDESFIQQLQDINADVFVVVAFRMLPKIVWQMPKLGTFNLHASLLPQYRGAAPINWAIINGEKETGVTTFLLNEEIDKGKILLQEKIDILPNDNAESIHDKLAIIGKDLVIKTVEGLANNSITPIEQQSYDESMLKPAPKIFKPDCTINWNKRGEEIVNFVRGLSPYPAATMQVTDSEKKTSISFKVFDVEFEPCTNAEKNKVYTDQKTYLKVGISDGYIRINALQMSGKKKNNIEDFLRGNSASNYILDI
jgi:methionyl-tRNA formyltransferase